MENIGSPSYAYFPNICTDFIIYFKNYVLLLNSLEIFKHWDILIEVDAHFPIF